LHSFRIGAGGNTFTREVQGTAYLPVSFVEAQYVWLTLPVTVVLLTLVFLVATIVKSRRLGTWKSSNLTTLQGLHPSISQNLGGLESLSVMDEKVEKVVVRLVYERGNGVGWRLVKTN